MMEQHDIRWKQRFQNFEKTLSYLDHALNIQKPDVTQRAGIVQFFELSYELAWKVLKDYLEDQGFTDIATPRAVIKKSYEIGLISNGHQWLQLLDDRNLTSHTYDESKALEVDRLIRQYYHPLFRELAAILKVKNV